MVIVVVLCWHLSEGGGWGCPVWSRMFKGKPRSWESRPCVWDVQRPEDGSWKGSASSETLSVVQTYTGDNWHFTQKLKLGAGFYETSSGLLDVEILTYAKQARCPIQGVRTGDIWEVEPEPMSLLEGWISAGQVGQRCDPCTTRSLASRGVRTNRVFTEGPQIPDMLPYVVLPAHILSHFATSCNILPHVAICCHMFPRFAMRVELTTGNRGTSVTTPSVLTPSGSCQPSTLWTVTKPPARELESIWRARSKTYFFLFHSILSFTTFLG